jgi:hypothetical protein
MMEHLPQELVGVLVQQPTLNPRRLMPALLKYQQRTVVDNNKELASFR